MTHNTQINKRDHTDIETILNVGRTNDGDIYIDIRVYRSGDVIEVGDITITQAELDEINDNLEPPKSKFFICPECGDIVTEDDIIKDLTTGGFGMCMCMFGNGRRTLVRYDPYTPNMEAITLDEMRVIRIMREFGVI